MNALVEEARKQGVDKIMGYYYPTAKNGMVKDFYAQMGFSKVSADAIGNSSWEIRIGQYETKDVHIRLISNNELTYIFDGE